MAFSKDVRQEVLMYKPGRRAACRKDALVRHTLRKILAQEQPAAFRIPV
jgi:hypothetical protein